MRTELERVIHHQLHAHAERRGAASVMPCWCIACGTCIDEPDHDHVCAAKLAAWSPTGILPANDTAR